ncbi:hypothetical protein CASFOL_036566 [Castilleja foliolosa]|uniref:Sororin C-terminal region domain-containing protein n=1 Tax=Castilleja foliolosa TaxID=1961234 RepID=A0ABD3BX36_9LAMI
MNRALEMWQDIPGIQEDTLSPKAIVNDPWSVFQQVLSISALKPHVPEKWAQQGRPRLAGSEFRAIQPWPAFHFHSLLFGPARDFAGNDEKGQSLSGGCRSKPLVIDLDEAGDIKFSKSWTDTKPKLKKKMSRIEEIKELPREFVEQQKAYYKEVDDFELPEEEISQDELD